MYYLFLYFKAFLNSVHWSLREFFFPDMVLYMFLSLKAASQQLNFSFHFPRNNSRWSNLAPLLPFLATSRNRDFFMSNREGEARWAANFSLFAASAMQVSSLSLCLLPRKHWSWFFLIACTRLLLTRRIILAGRRTNNGKEKFASMNFSFDYINAIHHIHINFLLLGSKVLRDE